MSFHIYFALSSGLSQPVSVPRGTLQKMRDHIANVEEKLGLETEQYLDNPPHWSCTSKALEGVEDDKLLCDTVERHNFMVRWFYDILAAERELPDGETITPGQAAEIWHGLELLDVPPERWTADFYKSRMDALYEAMRGRECEGISFSAKPLSPEQAGEVITFFSQWLDKEDIHLSVPHGHDLLATTDDYEWCPRCRAISIDEMLYTDWQDDEESDDAERDICPICKKNIND